MYVLDLRLTGRVNTMLRKIHSMEDLIQSEARNGWLSGRRGDSTVIHKTRYCSASKKGGAGYFRNATFYENGFY